MTFKTVTQSIRIAAEPRRVWDMLIDPQAGERWRNADFKTYWRVSGLPDTPQSWSTITMRVEVDAVETIVTVEQQVPPSPPRRGQGWEIGENSGWKHAAFYWRSALAMLKRAVEDQHEG
ncbi:hypothetical protein [Bradyrhizobium sp. Cp5.3]|uniref:hypothetical protein n=1 Tax=Bradyrhizobium sp. Cp5.3 TaxID=443598 RepID=UPI0003F827BC|nr:hypothetical protein [Bradyrhizobium sp. Cp5.3]